LKVIRGENISEGFPDAPVMKNGVVVDNRTHPREYTMKELIRALERYKLDIIRKGYFNFWEVPLGKRIVYKVCPAKLRSTLLVFAKKRWPHV
jgi:hypothetical protein